MKRTILYPHPRRGSAHGPRVIHRPRVGHRPRVVIGALAAAALGLAAALVPATSASANVPDTTVTVDVSQAGKTPTHAGAGFLYGLTQDGSGPSDGFLQPLAPTLFRGGAPIRGCFR